MGPSNIKELGPKQAGGGSPSTCDGQTLVDDASRRLNLPHIPEKRLSQDEVAPHPHRRLVVNSSCLASRGDGVSRRWCASTWGPKRRAATCTCSSAVIVLGRRCCFGTVRASAYTPSAWSRGASLRATRPIMPTESQRGCGPAFYRGRRPETSTYPNLSCCPSQ